MIPGFQSIMLPLLAYLADENEHVFRDVVEYLSDFFKLTEEERSATLSSGALTMNNRTAWARTYMKKAGLLESPRTGYIKITKRGLDVLDSNPDKINVKFLNQFSEFLDFRTGASFFNSGKKEEKNQELEIKTPDEMIEEGYSVMRSSLEEELLNKLRLISPAFFERIVVNLLSTMGYGEGLITGRSGDGGIDGIISQDKLGLGKIFIQAKRYGKDNKVSSPLIRDFLGAIVSRGMDQGIFITTSSFSRDAEETILNSHKRVVLIDGRKLVQLMIDYDFGVGIKKVYRIKEVDSDFFSED